MFGMNDPAQTLIQLERYILDGRMEMSEVMAMQFTEMFLARKKRSADDQIMLVKGLRILCDVLVARGKGVRAVASVHILLKERKKLVKILRHGAPHLIDQMTPEAEDQHRAGNVLASGGKKRAARKAYAKAEKLAPGNLSAALDACRYIGYEAKLIDWLALSCQAAGPVIHTGGTFMLEPVGSAPVDAGQVAEALLGAVPHGLGNSSLCAAQAQRIEDEKAAIMRGEAAANARLQSALDSLTPKHDYYEYS
ncbi:MAG TPA: hypothetical protein D7H93_05830 [Candidatus Poseidoniales archaeon]|nr:hypothetical protein [Candidatus Poseidoniaceae archaeon]DAC44666.1 MAG TPA: hypothetical protein D7H93_05830 [Candidatus Poseidoniales archaeon]HII22232.1 hypothetical protein [Candidatus Poseidoniaceae archaeon]